MASSLAFWIEKDKGGGTEEPNGQPNAEQRAPTQEQREGQLSTQTDGESSANNTKAKNDKGVAGVELHFNYWLLEAEKRSLCERMSICLPSSKKKSTAGNLEYLDIGVKFSNLGPLESLNIYLPFHIDKEDYVSTLGETICKDIELISTVFNRSVGKVEPNEELGCYNIELIQQGEATNSTLCFYTHLALAPSNDGVEIKKSDELDGTQIVFPGALFEGLQDGVTGYFRFRIALTTKNRGVISKINKAKDSWLTNHFDKSELVDFRLNEARILPTAIRRKVAKQQLIRKIHFFLIRDASAEYKAAHSEYKCRLLEEELWSKYLGYDEVCTRNNMLIYHWSDKAKEGSSLDNFSAFARFVRRKVSNWQLISFILTVIFMGFISGLCVNFVWKNWMESVQSVPDKLESEEDNVSHDFWVSEAESLFKIDKNSYYESHSVEGEFYEN